MKKFIRLVLPILILSIGFFSGKLYLIYKDYHRSCQMAFEKIYPIQEYKQFVIVIPSYNNEKWCEKNIQSVLEQDYPNYRVIYVNDCSSDQTVNKVKNLIKNSPIDMNLIDNQIRKGALQNIYEAVHLCKDDEIIVMLDGDDWLAHSQVLKKLNEVYANPKNWMSYGQYISYPLYQKGHCKRFEKECSFREEDWVFSHLKTFYASLFKKIKKQDLLFNGQFYQMSSDLAFMIPMLEMAGIDHIQFVSDILYIYNRSNPINDDKIDRAYQIACEENIRSKTKYQPLEECK